MKSCVIVFPLYQAPTEIELAFLENGLKLTAGFKQVIVAPEGLIIDPNFGDLQQLEVKRFAKHYFEGINGYNQLMLSSAFYKAFSLFDYILVHQADVYLFRNEVALWCEKNYDYVGAPWFRPDHLNRGLLYNLWLKLKLSFKKNKVYGQRYNKVGNGGFSLRKIATALQVLEKVEPALLRKYQQNDGSDYNEDIFWSLEAPLVIPNYRIPDLREGMEFAIEFHPEAAYQFLGQKLPFGCHAPLKYPQFWQKFIPIIKSNV